MLVWQKQFLCCISMIKLCLNCLRMIILLVLYKNVKSIYNCILCNWVLTWAMELLTHLSSVYTELFYPKKVFTQRRSHWIKQGILIKQNTKEGIKLPSFWDHANIFYNKLLLLQDISQCQQSILFLCSWNGCQWILSGIVNVEWWAEWSVACTETCCDHRFGVSFKIS